MHYLSSLLQLFPDVKATDRVYWSLRAGDPDHRSRSKDDELTSWLSPEKRFSDYNFKEEGLIS